MRTILMGAVLSLISFGLFAQTKLSGKVTDNNNQPLAGVNIIQKGSFLGTVSGIDGRFDISISGLTEPTLQFSFIGFKTVEQTATQGMIVVMEPSAIVTNEVTVSAVRAAKNTPVAAEEITAEEIQKINFGQDLPVLLDQMQSVVTTSDAGAGVGYTNFRIRGTDITRINVTVNGIPLNDAESNGVFWVNMPDFASSVDKLQIQRGVGTSTNGAASFGASVNMNTLSSSPNAYALIDNSYGSFNTMKNSISVGTGLLNNNLAFDVRLSRIATDGFIDRASSDLKSYYFSGGYYGKKSTIKLITFAGKETTFQAWNGVPKVKLDNDLAGMEKLILFDGWSEEETANLYNSDARTFNRYLYDNSTDNYQQDHYQLHFLHNFSGNLSLNAALHYTKGKGYYETYKYDKKFSSYNVGFDEVLIDGETVKRSDLIQRKWLDNDFYGGTFSVNYNHELLNLIVGGAYNEYDGDHYGNVIWWAVNNNISENFEWYRNNGKKKDGTLFAKATFNLNSKLSLYGDAQFRNVRYAMSGLHDDFTDLKSSYNFTFFNPKFGVNYLLNDANRIFTSFAVAQREPSRSDFRDAPEDKKPTPETLYDYELGYERKSNSYQFNLNAFYMSYKDQLVLTGKVNNVGAPITENVDKSYRAGIELSTAIRLNQAVQWAVNATLSTSKIQDYTEYVDNWSFDDKHPENGPKQYTKELGETDIAFSPNITVASTLSIMAAKGLNISLLSKYVGDQYIDNTSNEQRKLEAYFVNDLVFNYDFALPNIGTANIGLKVNNLFSEEYESNAWVYRYVYGGEHDVLDGYYTQAGRNFMVRLGLTF